VGVLAGFLNFVPYVGSVLAWSCRLLMTIVQFEDSARC